MVRTQVKKARLGDIVCIKWVDSFYNRHQHEIGQYERCESCKRPMSAEAVGFLVSNTKEQMLVASERFPFPGSPADYRTTNGIPKVNIKGIQVLKRAKK